MESYREQWEIQYSIQISRSVRVTDKKRLNHEHVKTRKTVKELMESAKTINELREIIDSLVACVVTKEEHYKLSKLGKGLEGWERYKKAGIKVYDVSGNEPKIFLE